MINRSNMKKRIEFEKTTGDLGRSEMFEIKRKASQTDEGMKSVYSERSF